MSVIGAYTQEEFKEDFPLEFGPNARGSLITVQGRGVCGMLEAHIINEQLCCGAVYWKAPVDNHDRPLWDLVELAPLTLKPSIRCSCGHHGHITDGRWVPTPDSTC